MPFGRQLRVEFVERLRAARSLYYQIDYTLQPRARRPTSVACTSSFRRENPTVDAARLRHRRRPPRPGPLPRLRRRRPRASTPAILVRRGRGEDLPRRRRRSRPSAARGSRTTSAARGAWARTTRRTAVRRSASCRAARPGAEAGLRRLLPMARARPDRCSSTSCGHDPADRRDVLPRGPGGGAGRVREDKSRRGRRLDARRRARTARVGHRRTGRRLLRHRLRVLHRAAAGARLDATAPWPTSSAATTSRRSRRKPCRASSTPRRPTGCSRARLPGRATTWRWSRSTSAPGRTTTSRSRHTGVLRRAAARADRANDDFAHAVHASSGRAVLDRDALG